MTEDILQEIKKKAEEKYPDPNLSANPLIYGKRIGYTSGCIEGIELMKGFMQILSDDFVEYPNGQWECVTEKRCELWKLQYDTFYTTDQLLEKYLTSK